MNRETVYETPESQHQPGERIGNYVLERPIGSGGFAEVWRATDSATNRSVALKIFFDRVVRDPSVWKAIREEPKKQPEHERIVPIYYCHLDSDSPGPYYVVMKLMPGGTLDELLERRQKLPPDEAVLIIRDVLAGLDFAHSQGIIHRDIKPTNILFDSNRRASIADFGIAKDLNKTGHSTVFGSVVGTAAYMSPEQAEGQRVSRASDIYSLGTVLYETLVGKLPFDGPTDTAIIIARSRDNPQAPRSLVPAIPERLEKVVLNTLEKDLEHRYPDCTSLTRALDWAAAPETVGPAPEAPPPPEPVGRSKKGLLVGAAAAVVLIAGGAAAWLTQKGTSSTPPPVPPPPSTAAKQVSVTPVSWKNIRFDDPRLSHCNQDQTCFGLKTRADKLQSTDWENVPSNSPLLYDCMGYPACEGRKLQDANAHGRPRALTDPMKKSNASGTTTEPDTDEKAVEKSKIFQKEKPNL